MEGMARRESEQTERQSVCSDVDSQSTNSTEGEGANSDPQNGEVDSAIEAASINPESNPIQYDLVGIVVHSGQANAGHYYSFIRDRRYVLISSSMQDGSE